MLSGEAGARRKSRRKQRQAAVHQRTASIAERQLGSGQDEHLARIVQQGRAFQTVGNLPAVGARVHIHAAADRPGDAVGKRQSAQPAAERLPRQGGKRHARLAPTARSRLRKDGTASS